MEASPSRTGVSRRWGCRFSQRWRETAASLQAAAMALRVGCTDNGGGGAGGWRFARRRSATVSCREGGKAADEEEEEELQWEDSLVEHGGAKRVEGGVEETRI